MAHQLPGSGFLARVDDHRNRVAGDDAEKVKIKGENDSQGYDPKYHSAEEKIKSSHSLPVKHWMLFPISLFQYCLSDASQELPRFAPENMSLDKNATINNLLILNIFHAEWYLVRMRLSKFSYSQMPRKYRLRNDIGRFSISNNT
jgi:hypothetical protein